MTGHVTYRWKLDRAIVGLLTSVGRPISVLGGTECLTWGSDDENAGGDGELDVPGETSE
jgi:hypothetical protein